MSQQITQGSVYKAIFVSSEFNSKSKANQLSSRMIFKKYFQSNHSQH